MNVAWITGTMSEEEMAEEHPLELSSLQGEESQLLEERQPGRRSEQVGRGVEREVHPERRGRS